MTHEPTRARLIEAAGEEFAEKGFDDATIRSICRRAEANLAAVNYHFGDKGRLYEETLHEAHRCGSWEEADPDATDAGTPADRLRAFIASFLDGVFDSSSMGWRRTLMLRELIRPTLASDILVEVAIRPRFEKLKALVREFRPEADETRLNALVFSVVGQILHYRLARGFSERLIGSENYAKLDKAYLTDHITGFCLAALGADQPRVRVAERRPNLAAEESR